MDRILLLSLLFVFASFFSFSQHANDILAGGGFDLIKTDNDGFVQKAQISLEGNYFLTKQFTATAGFDIWTGDGVNLVVGGRWYPIDNFFTRLRGLICENDISMGAGWNKPITENWQFEAMGDFYFEGEFGIRVGLMYVIQR
jgi:hypothetical protein